MTIRTKRRGRRSLAAIAAALLMASVLAVVAGSPAQAANTASEHMVDTNDDGKADSREFAGADRYETALKLANRYAADKGGRGSVTTVIIASGETLIDAVTSAALSSVQQAPVLLTRSTGIDRGVANYIEDHGVISVIVVGGTAVVPDSVLDEIEALDSEPKVRRVAGDDRAATAAAIAGELPGAVNWCGIDEPAAILVNGSDGPAIDAIASGPLVYALELPMLLTAADELPEATADYFSDEDIERVVIVGGTDAVSKDVQDAVDGMGIKTERISNGERSGTSVELAKLVLGEGKCADEVGATSNMVALVNSEATADGVSAGPVLGAGIGGSGPIPVLLVDDTLPEAVRDYLAATPAEVGGLKQHLTIVAVGGTAAVSEAVMDAAIDAASSADALTAEIKAEEGSTMFTVTFSDNLNSDATFSLNDKLKDVFYVNGVAASIAGGATPTIGAPVDTQSATCGTAQSVEVTLTHQLKKGDEIEIRPTATKFGADEDQRPLQPASFTVPAADVDTAGPSVEIIAIEGSSAVYLLASEAGDLDVDDISVISQRPATVAIAEEGTGTAATAANGMTPFGAVLYQVNLTFGADFDINGDGDTADDGEFASGSAYTLAKSDVVRLAAGAVTDSQTPANGSRSDRETVDARVKSFSASTIRISPTDPGVDDDPTTTKIPSVNGIDADSSGTVEATEAAFSRNATVAIESVNITAKWSGAASGAAGNDWSVTTDSASGLDSTAKTAEIDVSVNSRNKVIRVRYMDGSPTRQDLVNELNGNAEFAKMFNATTACADAKTELTRVQYASGDATNPGDLTGGRSTVAFMVTFSDYINTLTGTAAGDNLRDDVLNALITGYEAAPGQASDLASVDEATTPNFAEVRFNSNGAASVGVSKQVYIRFTTSNAMNIPSTRSGPGRGTVTVGGDDPKQAEATSVHVATSHAAEVDSAPPALDNDPTNDNVLESRNAESKPKVTLDRNLKVVN